MKKYYKILITVFVLMLIQQTYLIAAENGYQPNTGDSQLDAAMISVNKKFKEKYKTRLIRVLADEFQIPVEKVEALFNVYEFTAADAIVCVSMADTSGEPLNAISNSYYKNKKQGWKFIFNQMKIRPGSPVLTQIKKDILIKYK